MDQLFLAVYGIKSEETNNPSFTVPLETVVLFLALKFCENPSTEVILVEENNVNDKVYHVSDDRSVYSRIIQEKNVPQLVKDCVLPAILLQEKNTCIAGLCAVLRHVIKKVVELRPSHPCRKLLGFRNGCLIACAEASTWTRFCEVEIIRATTSLVQGHCKSSGVVLIPEELAKFEQHLNQPVRIHNILKRQQNDAKLHQVSKKEGKDVTEVRSNGSATRHCAIVPESVISELQHTYAEGPDFTLADIILFSCYHIIFEYFKNLNLNQYLPLTAKWFHNISHEPLINKSKDVIIETSRTSQGGASLQVIIPEVPCESLYKRDPRRYKPRHRIFTRQEDIERSLEITNSGGINIHYEELSWKDSDKLDWDTLPTSVHPQGGDLPPSRLQRKCQQLESVAQAVLKTAKDNEVIVDFCSGGGHLGILLAHLLPSSTVVMVENKEESLARAKARVAKLGMKNAFFYQCNLDYYIGSFTIGVSLHGCGVATDLVLQRCLHQRAAYISCPCCYGSVQNTHLVTYPRSRAFKGLGLTLRDYLVIGHAADQTHDEENVKTKQGKFCMGIIDTDRNLQAVDEGYVVMLCKLKPESCSPKNNLLIGVPAEKLLEKSLSVC